MIQWIIDHITRAAIVRQEIAYLIVQVGSASRMPANTPKNGIFRYTGSDLGKKNGICLFHMTI
jgi:hypothetical protein